MADTVLKGSVQIELDGSGLEARLIYKPDENGEEWNREKILAVLEKSHITEGIQNSEIDKLLTAPPSKDGEPVTIVGARGEPMEPPEEEKVEWDGWDVPEEMRSSIEKIVRSAGEPVITQVRVEKIKKKQKVEKKAKLSFLPSKEEIVEVVEKKEIKENIEVDPAVEAWGWLTAGGRIARVLPSKPGKVGKDIYGTPIMPEKELAPAVYPGANIEVRGNDLIAKETGIVRRGGNWVEVIPFAPHAWSLHLSKDQVTCLLDFTPGTPEADVPDAVDVHAQAVELGADQATLLDEKELQGLLAEICSNGAEVHDYSISRDEDGSVEITVSEDKLKAFLSLKKGRGNGTPLDLKNVGKVLRESGVKGFKPDKVKQDILAFYRGPEQHQEEYLLAEGTPPEEPQPRKLVFNVQFVPDKERDALKNRIIAAGSAAASGITSTRDFPVDMVDGVGFVARHQTFAYLEEVQKPAAGKDVYGKEIAPADVPEQIVNTFENVETDKGTFVAGISGLLEKAEKESEFFFRIRPHRDGEAELRIDEEKMHAFLTVLPAEGAGDPVSGDQVWKLLKDRGVISGIREDVIEAAVKQVNDGEGIENLLVAQGEEPSHGSTNRMDMLVEMASGKNVTIRNDGSADYKNLQKITMVSKGQKIARLMPPEEKGEDGRDIFGKVIPAKKYQGFDLDIGAHIARQEEEDGSVLLIAETDGRLEYDKKSIYIERAFQVAGDVDIKTGNIKFKGAVQIKGSVQTGFSVISTDSIQIGESVEGALVSADGDIVVNQGIKGGGKAVLRTKESVKALFAEQSRILAVKDVIFKNFCLRSIVKCNGKMVLMSDKGHFIGGSARARYGMEVMNLGSEKEVKTEVCFGQDYLIADQIEIEEREINKIKEKLLSFDVFMLKMEKQGERERLERARKEKLKLMKFLEKHSLRLFTLREKFEEHYPSEIVVKGYLYPGVVIESHGRIFSPKTAKKGVKIVFNQESGQLEEQSLSEK